MFDLTSMKSEFMQNELCSCWLWILLHKQLFKIEKAVEYSDENVKIWGTKLLSKDSFFTGI